MKRGTSLMLAFALTMLAISVPFGVAGQSTATPAPPDAATVTLTEEATVMSLPEDSAAPLGKLPAGTSLPTNGRLQDSSWWQVPYPGGPDGNGWLPASAVKPSANAADVPVYELATPTPGATAGAGAALTLKVDATIMSWPDDNSTKLGELPANSSVPTNGRLKDSSWWQVPYPGGPNGNGWIQASEVEPNAAAADVPIIEVIVPTPEAPPVQPTSAACQYNSVFVTDVTIPDGTQIDAAQSFDKVWRVENAGTCPWGSETLLNFIGGDQMSAPASVSVPSTEPGQTADIGVTMFAPSSPGRHNSIWQMEHSGQFFGTKLNALIDVPNPNPPTAVPPAPPTPLPPPTGAPQPNINFYADQYRVDAGQCTNLHWDVDNVQAVYLEYYNHKEGVGGHDHRQVCPSSDGKRYTLDVVANDGQQYTRELEININDAPTPAPPPPVSIKFWSDHHKITIGTSTKVHWEVHNAKKVWFNNGGAGWNQVDKKGSVTVSPAYPTNYGLRVEDKSGQTHERSLTIKTKAPPPGILTPVPVTTGS